MNTLHLIHTKNTKCGSLSGGQRKRLSIALELLDNPPVLFLDEPTTYVSSEIAHFPPFAILSQKCIYIYSGLDSSSSAYCVRLLHNLAREGRTIVCTIHKPAATVYEMFDHVYVLAEGHCIFQGSPGSTVPYLSSVGLQCPQYHNPADFRMFSYTLNIKSIYNLLYFILSSWSSQRRVWQFHKCNGDRRCWRQMAFDERLHCQFCQHILPTTDGTVPVGTTGHR